MEEEGGGGLLEERGELIDCLECWFCLVMTFDCRLQIFAKLLVVCNNVVVELVNLLFLQYLTRFSMSSLKSIPGLVTHSTSGWGPSTTRVTAKVLQTDIPYAPFGKSDKIGRIADPDSVLYKGMYPCFNPPIPKTRWTPTPFIFIFPSSSLPPLPPSHSPPPLPLPHSSLSLLHTLFCVRHVDWIGRWRERKWGVQRRRAWLAFTLSIFFFNSTRRNCMCLLLYFFVHDL